MMKNNLFYISILFISILLLFDFNSNAQTPGFIVAKDSSGDFTSLQAAIDATPSNSNNRTEIYIKNGIYYELINISSNKTNLTLIGESADSTIITYDNGARTINPATGAEFGTSGSRSVQIDGAGFFALNVSFQNNADPSLGQAVAVKCQADKSVFKNCKFLGNQDTYYPDKGRSYHENCYFEGTTDFIFGGGIAFFENCHIYSKGGTSLTAARTGENVKYGFVFNNCNITGSGSNITDLGRPWRPYASVTFLNSNISNAIKAEGWNNWRDPSNEETARFAEYNNTGDGADLSERVSWMKKLKAAEAMEYNVLNVLKATNANPQVIDNWNPFDVLGVSHSDITIYLNSPTENAGFDENSSITIKADASVTNSIIACVTFYGDSLLYQDNEYPYTFIWDSVKSGMYDILTTATDTSGYTVYSKKNSIFVGQGVSISKPTDGSKYDLLADIPIKAEAWVSDGSITKVEFFQGIILLGTDNSQPYSYVWKTVPPGTYILTCKATDSNDNILSSNEATVTVAGGPVGFDYCSPEGDTCTFDGVFHIAYGGNYRFFYKNYVTGSVGCNSDVFGDPNPGATKACFIQAVTHPEISIISPVAGASFQAPANITIIADALDYDGTIDSVIFFQNNNFIGVLTAEPYTFTWENVNAGNYQITTKAIDNVGNSTTSRGINVTVTEATNIINIDNNEVMLYPNPVSDELTLRIKNNSPDNYIILYNNQGKVIVKKKFIENELVLDIKNIPDGIYLISLNNKNKEVFSRKIMKN